MFQTTGYLNPPPSLLKTAVTDIRARFEIIGHRLDETVKKVVTGNPSLREKYERPHPGSDRLYQSLITHPLDEDAPCAEVCGDHPSMLVPQEARRDNDDIPAIHYGLIASGN